MVLLKETQASGAAGQSEEKVDGDYFSSYDDVEVHRLMIRDRARTESYQRAITDNQHYFKDKIVMDVGAGTGVLSLFAMKAGAKKVFAVEASPLAEVLKEIVKLNDEEGIIEVIQGKAEEIELENNTKVDIMISEWMGFYLFHESMLDSVILARDKHLADEGIMLPSHASLQAAPVSLDIWLEEQFTSWHQVYGFNMAPMAQRAVEAKLAQGKPEVMQLSASSLLCDPVSVGERLDLRWVQREEVAKIEDTKFVSVTSPGNFHGLALWFDVSFAPLIFEDSDSDVPFQPVELKTGPADPETHWKQTVLVVMENLAQADVEEDEILGWKLDLQQSEDNRRQYTISLSLLDPETEPHPAPCRCHMARCELVAALMEKEDREMEDLEEINTDQVSS